MPTTFRNLRKQPAYLLLLLAVLPILVVIAVTIRYGYTVPWLDEYSHITQLVRLHIKGGMSLSNLTYQVCDHRLFFPFLLTLIFTDLSGGSTALELGFSIALMLISLYLVCQIYRLQHPNQAHALYFIIPASLLIFSLGQRENWLWGSQKCIFMVLACVYVVAWALERFPRSFATIVIGAFAAIVASWSFISGNLLWVIIPIALWLNGYRKISVYVLWGAAAALHFALFLNGYARSTLATSAGAGADLVYFVHYFVAFLGGAFTPETHHLMEWYNPHAAGTTQTLIAETMGVIGLCLLFLNLGYAFFVHKMTLRSFSPWALLIGFSVSNGALLSLGRAGEIYFALAARYISLIVPFWIALFALIFFNLSHYFRSRSRMRRIAVFLVLVNSLALLVFGAGYAANFRRAADAIESHNDVAEVCYLTQMSGDARCDLPQFFTNNLPSEQPFVAELISFLQQNRMYILRRPSLTLSLLDIDRSIVEDGGVRVLEDYTVQQSSAPVLLTPARSVVEQSFILPDVPGILTLETAADLEVASNQALEQGGVVFRLNIRDQNQAELFNSELSFDASVQASPVPVDFDLSPYRGERIFLRYETESSAPPTDALPVWVNPRIEIMPAAS
ncbi:MAG: hypothetical protein ABI835_02320 [Chloroflexota bacterium]